MRQQTITLPKRITGGCLINPSGKFIFSNYFERQLIILTKGAKPDSVIDTLTRYPIDVTCIDDLSVTVSFHDEVVIHFINITSKKTIKTINTLKLCGGITHQNNQILYCNIFKDVSVVKLPNTESFLSVEDKELSCWCYITTYMDKLCYTKNNTINCYSLTGKKLWELKDESLLKSACGVTADKHSNICVAYFENNIIVVISPDD